MTVFKPKTDRQIFFLTLKFYSGFIYRELILFFKYIGPHKYESSIYNLPYKIRSKSKSYTRELIKFLYRNLYDIDTNQTMLPETGKGRYVDVYSKGGIIEITPRIPVNEIGGNMRAKGAYDKLLIIPYQPNHGVFVEFWKKGVMCSRSILSFDQLSKHIIYASNVEQLVGFDNIDIEAKRTKDINSHYMHNGDFNVPFIEEKEIHKLFSKYPKDFSITKDDISNFDHHLSKKLKDDEIHGI